MTRLYQTPTSLAVCTSTYWRPAQHLAVVEQAVLSAIANSKIVCISMPPRHGKSELCSHWLPVWYTTTHPDHTVILTSYSASLARQFGRRVRDTRESLASTLRVPGIRTDSRSASDWQNGGGLGGLLSSGVGGSITGRGGHLILCDDPIKNAQDSLSEVVRESVWQWFRSTLWTRLEPRGCLIVIATRWHVDDLIGRILSEGPSMFGRPVMEVSLPAISEEGHALWPDRWPLEQLEKQRVLLGDYWWDALYQQQPSAAGVGGWPNEYFDNLWAHYPDNPIAAVIAVDIASGQSVSRGDYGAVCMLAFTGQRLHAKMHLRREPPEATVEIAALWARQHKVTRIVIESPGYASLIGGAIEAAFVKHSVTGVRVELVTNVVPKTVRIQRLGAYLQQGQLAIADDVHGRLTYQQLRDFPFGKHDDGPDAIEMAVRFLPQTANPMTVRRIKA